MDSYEASIASVDTALNRLNQTMAEYQISKAKQPTDAQSSGTEAQLRPGESLSEHVHRSILELRNDIHYPEEAGGAFRLQRLQEAMRMTPDNPYNPLIHVFVAIEFLGLGYPDLAVGSAYKALLLIDAIGDMEDEYHYEGFAALLPIIEAQPPEDRQRMVLQVLGGKDEREFRFMSNMDVEMFSWLPHYRLLIYRILIRSLIACGCLQSAHQYIGIAQGAFPDDYELEDLLDEVQARGRERVPHSDSTDTSREWLEWPDASLARRELYPWNEHEPDRLKELPTLNSMMHEVAPKLDVRAVQLPALAQGSTGTVTQLGVFAAEDLKPGEVILDETSLLTANNKLQDALCDACSSDLPDLSTAAATSVVACPECEVVFCSQRCLDLAMAAYHPALCDKDVEAIAKDVPPAGAADALYALLLLRALAMAQTQDVHPLDLREAKYIWGDFTATPPAMLPGSSAGARETAAAAAAAPRTLPFSFEHNVRMPFHMLEKMDVDIFAQPGADVWVFNTLYAKFRSTASARLSGLAGRPVRGPEVSAVHPMWCLANHSCDPNVRWAWGGSVRFEVREQRAEWHSRDGGKAVAAATGGIAKDEEVLNHYCDIDLPVRERREWAQGALGGDCQCDRCKWESRETA